MNIFKVVPENFFSILASPLKVYYSDVLFLIYNQYKLTSFGITREVVMDMIMDYIEGLNDDEIYSEMDREFVTESQNARERAAVVLRKLEETGWIMVETYSDYTQYINLTDHGIMMLDTLDKIRKNYRPEYQGYVYAIYSILYSRDADRQGHIALDKAHEQTENLINGLKSLNHNIKKYIQKIVEYKEPAEILKMHFDRYKEEIIDKNYHRLKTSDHISRYRPAIIRKINDWARDGNWTEKTAEQYVKNGFAEDIESARKEVFRKLNYISDSFSGIDRLLGEIDRRNSRYVSASLRQVEILLNSNRDTEGQLVEILKYLSGLMDRKDREGLEEIREMFNLFFQNYLDSGSLYTPRTAGREHIPEEVEELQPYDEARKREKLARLKQAMASKLNRSKVNRYILEKMGDRNSISAGELGVDTVKDFVKLIYAVSYHKSSRMGYRVRFDVDDLIRTADYEFKNYIFEKKE